MCFLTVNSLAENIDIDSLRCCLEQDAAALSRCSQMSREEIETNCFILASAKIQLSSGKCINGYLRLQLKEKQMWELSTQHQYIYIFFCRKATVNCSSVLVTKWCLTSLHTTVVQWAACTGCIHCSLVWEVMAGKGHKKGGREWRRMEFCTGHSSP